MKRRELMAGSGGVLTALLAGRIPTAQAREDQWDQQLVETPETAIELLPDASSIDAEYVRILRTTLEGTDDTNQVPYGHTVGDAIDGIDLADVETIAVAWTADQQAIRAVSGSFERPEPGEKVSERGDWRIGTDDSESLTVASTDDLMVLLDSSQWESPVDAAETAARVGRGIADSAIERSDTLAVAFGRLGDKKVFYYVPDLGTGLPTEAADRLETISAGFEISPAEMRGYDGRLENEFLLERADDADLDDDDVEAIVRELEQGTVLEIETEYDDEFVFVETVVEAPPERNREAAPDARIEMQGNPNEGTATLEHQSGDAVPAADLELWIDGELADTQPADEFERFESGDSLSVETGPLASVFLRWIDDSANEYYEYVNDVVGESAFETEYDPSGGAVELTYTGELDADPELLELEHRWQVTENGTTRFEREQLTEPVAAVGDSLTAGDTIVVDDVDLRDTLTLSLDVPSKPPGTFGPDTTLVRFHVREPRFFVRRRPGEAPVVEYVEGTERDAEEFRILVDGTEAGSQLADEYDTLERGDRVSLDPVEFGTEIVIQWLGSEEPIVVEEHVVEPLVQFDITYDDGDSTVTIEHVEGEDVDAGALELLVDGTPAETQPADQYDVFGEGDAITAAADPFTRVTVQWVDGSTALTLTDGVTGSRLFTAAYDPASGTVELTYTGQQAVDPERLGVRRYDTPPSDLTTPFAEAYGTLTAGDSVTLEAVDPEGLVEIVLADGAESKRNTIFRYRPEPSHAFDFENRDGTLVAVYERRNPRDAGAFRFLADGTETGTQPVDEHDTLEEGDEIELGSFTPGTTLVVEWPAGHDPSEVQRYVVVPGATFEASYDDEADVVRVEHTGGGEIDADDLSVYVPTVTEQPVAWDGDGPVSEGDSMTIDVDEKPDVVVVLYREQELLAELRLDE